MSMLGENHWGAEHYFTTYVRTRILFKRRLKDLDEGDYSKVKLYVYELKKLGVNHGPFLYSLKMRGEIDYDKVGNFWVTKDGPVDPSLIQVTKKEPKQSAILEPVHLFMRDLLKFVSIDMRGGVDLPVYFKTFLDHKGGDLGPFFSVDAFSGRVHTPVVNLKSDLRGRLRFFGKPVVSLDVKQMQPTILAKSLSEAIGKNPFSDAVLAGEDVYDHLLAENSKLKTRSEAKKFFFELVFGKPRNDIASMFKGDGKWVEWINDYKRKVIPENPHSSTTHSNLAWLLQRNEVFVMRGAWERLMRLKIPFLTIHDAILCLERDEAVVLEILDEVLAGVFVKYEITSEKYKN